MLARLPARPLRHSHRRLRPSCAALPRGASRVESVKAAALAALTGSLVAAPVTFFLPALLPDVPFPAPLSPQWEFCTDTLAASLALFGLVFRYTAREDGTLQLKGGVVGAFVSLRSLASVTVSPACTPIPLVCGPPLIYADWAMLGAFLATALPAGVAFGSAALALEAAWASGLLARASDGGADLDAV